MCEHMQFNANVVVNRIEDRGLFVADVTIECAECKLPFQFVGVEPGMSYTVPRTSIDRRELRAPIAIDTAEAIVRAAGTPSFLVRMGGARRMD